MVFSWYILVKEGTGVSVQQCADEQTAMATVIALFSEHREVIEAGRLRGKPGSRDSHALILLSVGRQPLHSRDILSEVTRLVHEAHRISN